MYSEFGLEKTGHQLFDRTTWPADFQGVLEPDYFAEAKNDGLGRDCFDRLAGSTRIGGKSQLLKLRVFYMF